MIPDDLFQIVRLFVEITKDLNDVDLDQPWAWRFYDSEGVRFAFLRTYEELQELAVKLELERVNLGIPITSAQRILGQYHAAFRDLEAVLLRVTSDIEETPPADGQWSVKETLSHIIRADLGFFVAIQYAIERHRTGDGRPAKIPDEAWERIGGVDEATYDALIDGPYEDLSQYHVELHQRILHGLEDLSEQELEMGSKYWEDEEMSFRFRFHRFDSHMRQHTVQIEKALNSLSRVPNEAMRLLRHLYRALAACESVMIGMPDVGKPLRIEIANTINARIDEIAAIL